MANAWLAKYPLLSQIDSPQDFRDFPAEQLEVLVSELREYILDVVSVRQGHLGANLGVIELTVALHAVFNTPHDRLIWDVGHQAYAHKILTGRADVFLTLREMDGISGFPSPEESIYDAFGTGHSSTSLSAALGMAQAARLSGDVHREHIAVIGDTSVASGMAMEAINQAANLDVNLLVIINDNSMGIDPCAGAMHTHLCELKKNPNGQNVFRSLGFDYMLVEDGHNLPKLIQALEQEKEKKGKRILHVVTRKGKGFEAAEKEQLLYHFPGQFDRETGCMIAPDGKKKERYQDVFGRALCELAAKDDKIVAVSPAMPTSSGLSDMMNRFPERVFDVGIAEEHALTFSAALAKEGFKPYCVIYSTFLQRAYDQLIHDAALQKLPVRLFVDRAGLVGKDGPTHHGVFDMAFLSSIPNVTLAAPMDGEDLRNLVYTASFHEQGVFAVRYPRGEAPDDVLPGSKMLRLPIGKGRCLKEGKTIAVISIGAIGYHVTDALALLTEGEREEVGHYDLRFIKPLDGRMLGDIFSRYRTVITVEEGVLIGGAGDRIADFAMNNRYRADVVKLGLPDSFITHGTVDELYRLVGLDRENIAEVIREKLAVFL